MMTKAPDDEIKALEDRSGTADCRHDRTGCQGAIAPFEALIRALQWRSPAKLEEVKKVVESEQAAGRKVRLKGRESCLFVEAGGTEDEPKVCIQV